MFVYNKSTNHSWAAGIYNRLFSWDKHHTKDKPVVFLLCLSEESLLWRPPTSRGRCPVCTRSRLSEGVLRIWWTEQRAAGLSETTRTEPLPTLETWFSADTWEGETSCDLPSNSLLFFTFKCGDQSWCFWMYILYTEVFIDRLRL